jgi:hypothetical protein
MSFYTSVEQSNTTRQRFSSVLGVLNSQKSWPTAIDRPKPSLGMNDLRLADSPEA